MEYVDIVNIGYIVRLQEGDSNFFLLANVQVTAKKPILYIIISFRHFKGGMLCGNGRIKINLSQSGRLGFEAELRFKIFPLAPYFAEHLQGKCTVLNFKR